MKKIISLASAALLVCSCSNEIDQVVNEPVVDRTILFDTYIPGKTRNVSQEATSSEVLSKGFFVMASNSVTKTEEFNDLFFKKDEASRIAGTTDHLWSKYALDFLALYPAASAGVEKVFRNDTARVTDTIYVKTYSDRQSDGVPGLFNGLEDVMIAKAEKKTQDDGAVSLTFQHLLVKVQASLAFDEGYMTPRADKPELVEGPKIMGVYLNGKKSGYYDCKENHWIKDYTRGEAMQGDSTETFCLFYPSVSTYGKEEFEPLRDKVSVMEPDGSSMEESVDASVMIIPGEYELKVEYQYPEYVNKSMTTKIDLSDVSKFAGKVVTLNIKVKDNRISFAEPTVAPWGTASAVSVEQ